MEKDVRSMNGKDFLRFMKKSNSVTSIIKEYYSIVSNTNNELCSASIHNEMESENFGGLQFVRYLQRRVKIRTVMGQETILNGTFVDGYDIERKYICMQVLPEDARDKFWQAVWDHKVQIIVTMRELSDKIPYQYRAPEKGCVPVRDKLEVKTLEVSVKPHCKLSLLSLTDQFGREHKISHYQYTAWPMDNFSHQLKDLIDFFCNVRDMYLQLERQATHKKIAPMIAQCINGVSSCAVFCLFDICVAQFEKTGTISLPSVLKKVRPQKYGFMNGVDSYVLCYQLLEAYVEKNLILQQCRTFSAQSHSK